MVIMANLKKRKENKNIDGDDAVICRPLDYKVQTYSLGKDFDSTLYYSSNRKKNHNYNQDIKKN